ncbi:DMT family transporter [Neorhizobium galegae]|uniref:DMT family transporter n=1 Tax=Neorhizobium galegae TaxID=399 RepID=UPI000620F840|nr:DMT family transporter [Neorhizobium galegae]MCQ1765429.1 DMT family transporter [Neorhizobium galegae]MCQ1844343.1 DMT family transporter [Neorhizobium galegae]CDZ33229.1 Possible transporter, RarD family, DMT superfamily [Neorhizobium galegae bv. officinalis]
MNSSPASLAASAPNRIVNGLGLMIVAMLIAPFIDIFSKLATDTASPTFITAARFVFQALCMLPIVLWNGYWRTFSWRLSVFHAIRASLITVSMVCFVATLAVMEVADAIAIFFVEPIILTVLSSIFLKETIGWRRYTACAAGFVGAMIVIRPSFQEIGFVALLPIVTAFCVAIFAILTRALAHREDPWSMQFQMALWGIPISAILLFVGDRTGIAFLAPSMPDWTSLLWLVGVGAFAALSGILAVYAYRAAPASVIAPLQYFEIVSATLFGWLVFGDFPDPVKWLGISIIIGSGLYIIWRERRVASMKPVTTAAKSTVTP